MTAIPAVLDWSDRRHWRGGLDTAWSHPAGAQGSKYHGRNITTGQDHRASCRICGNPTFLADGAGRPCHKVCAEHELGGVA